MSRLAHSTSSHAPELLPGGPGNHSGSNASQNTSRPSPHEIGGFGERMSYGKSRTTRRANSYASTVDHARERFVAAVRSVPVKHVSEPGLLSEDTVQAWRGGQDPSFPKAMFAGQRVPAIQEAILDILLANSPERRAAFRHLPQLIASLAEIAALPDEIARTIALRALKQFGSSE